MAVSPIYFMDVRTDYDESKVKAELEKQALKELRQIAHKNFAIANKRITRLQQSNISSPALNALEKKRSGHVKFTQGGKNLKQLQKELAECYSFLNLETSTVRGARHFEKQVENLVGAKYSDKKRVSQLFDLLHGIQERMPTAVFGNAVGSDPIMNDILEVIDSNTDIDLSRMKLTDAQREDIITKAIDKLVKQITQNVKWGENQLENIATDFNKMF